MAGLICPECSFTNLVSAERCQECNAPLLEGADSETWDSEQFNQEDFDFLHQAEDDLPGLLHALKQNAEGDTKEETAFKAQEVPVDQEVDDPGEEQNVPEWLQRIRNRAENEGDSVGEITQKITATTESLSEGKSNSEDEAYRAWINTIHPADQAGEKTDDIEDAQDAPKKVSEPRLDWLARIRKAHGTLKNDETQENLIDPITGGDSLLQWLVSLEDGETATDQDLSELTSEEAENSVGDIVEPGSQSKFSDRELTLPLTVHDQAIIKKKKPDLNVSRDEKILVDQLSATILDEKLTRPIRETGRPTSAKVGRMLIVLFLFLILSLSLFAGQEGQAPAGNLMPHNQTLLSWVKDHSQGASLLLVFDYQPAFADEISLVAEPLLDVLIQAESNVFIVASSPSGMLLSSRMLERFAFTEDQVVKDLGYFPLPAYGAYGMANFTQSNWQFIHYPKTGASPTIRGLDAIIILSDTYEGARAWVEQLSVLMPGTTIHLLLTAQAGPMMKPYWESGQVAGIISGFEEAARVDTVLAANQAVARRWRAYQAGTILMMGLLVISAVFFTDRHAEGSRGEA